MRSTLSDSGGKAFSDASDTSLSSTSEFITVTVDFFKLRALSTRFPLQVVSVFKWMLCLGPSDGVESTSKGGSTDSFSRVYNYYFADVCLPTRGATIP